MAGTRGSSKGEAEGLLEADLVCGINCQSEYPRSRSTKLLLRSDPELYRSNATGVGADYGGPGTGIL